jgi:hypothetical protein
LQPMLLWMSHMSTSLSHWLLIFYKPLEDYVWDLTSVRCFYGWCFAIGLVPFHFVSCETHATSWISLPSLS